MLNVENIRKDFPILLREVNGHSLIYFDNAATSQTPSCVTQAIVAYYNGYNANIHRGVHQLSQEATQSYEQSRVKLQKHFNAKYSKEIIFTSGTTHAINLVASGMKSFIKPGDEIWVSATEHHSNIVPWQMLCEQTQALLRVIQVDEEGMLSLDEFSRSVSPKTKLICCQHVSNALGTIHNIKEIIQIAKRVNAITVIDGAQACPHIGVDVQALDVDFYAISAHKMYGPTGIGALYGKKALLERMLPYQGGGEMIKEVCWGKTTYADLPYKFEAGTPNICSAIAFGKALDYIHGIGLSNIAAYEYRLLEYATEKLLNIDEVCIYGVKDLQHKTPVISFNLKGIHPYDAGVLLDKMGIAVRTGHHCAQPTMDRYKISGTIRASFAVYNTFEEIDRFIEAILKVQQMLS